VRITNKQKTQIKRSVSAFCFCLMLLLTGCGQSRYDIAYAVNSDVSSLRLVNIEEKNLSAEPFASGLCVVSSDISIPGINTSKADGVGLFDVNSKNTLYAKNAHEKLYPASLTKIMTALVALKFGSMDTTLTASANVRNLESGAQTCGLKEGDQMTLDQALHVLLINSANDAAIMIAEGIAGSVEAFADMMNQQALEIGACKSTRSF